MNETVYRAALLAGCTVRQSQLLAYYAASATLAEAASKLGISENTAKNHMTAIRHKLKAPHAFAVAARFLQ